MQKAIIQFIAMSILCIPLSGQTVGTGQLKINFNHTANGVTVSGIQNGSTEILQTADEIFTLIVQHAGDNS